jgi:hypothetical protein
VRERCRAAHPGGLSCQIVGFEPFAPPIEGSGAPKFAGAERRTRWPALRHSLSRQRTGLPAHNADRRASRRSTAAFSLDLETAFWKRTGAPIRYALDSAGFHPPSSAPPARCRTDPCSWAGRCLPRPPEARLARPNPQAPPRSTNKRHRLAPSASRDGWNIVAVGRENQAGGSRNL